ALAVQPSFGWSVRGLGAIGGTGLYPAPASGAGWATVTAANGNVRGSAYVSVAGMSSVFSLAGDGRVAYFGSDGLGQTQWDEAHDAATGSQADFTLASRGLWASTGA